MEYKINEVKISDVKLAEYNPRRLTPDQEKNLTDSLTTFGFVDPVIINQHPGREFTLVGGHQRLKVWKKLGHDTVPAVFVLLPLEREKELNVRLNKNTGEFDFDLLIENFDVMDLIDWGFTADELLKKDKLKTKDDDILPIEITPIAKRGDVWSLNGHRLMCGDSTDPTDVAVLMNGAKADMIWTDPPYNVNYSGRGKNTSNKIENDNQTEEAFRDFLNKTFDVYSKIIKPEAALYCCYASRTHREFEDALNAAGFETKNQIIWVKLVASMGWGDYRWKHEPIFYCHLKGTQASFYGDRKQYTTWEEEKSDEELLAMVKAQIKKEESGGSTVWRFNREQNYEHPTQKPVELITKALINSSKTGQLAVDLFGGSGSTMIASEKMARNCYTMELDPKYVDTILARFRSWCATNERPCEIKKLNTNNNTNNIDKKDKVTKNVTGIQG